MTVAYTDFIAAFPEFSDTVKYPQSQINFWLAQGYQQLNAKRFGGQLDLAVMLYTAHNVVMGARAAASADSGAVVGEATGVVSSKSIDKVSVSYDTTSVADARAGQWNATSYGQRLWQLMKAYGTGPQYFVPGRC